MPCPLVVQVCSHAAVRRAAQFALRPTVLHVEMANGEGASTGGLLGRCRSLEAEMFVRLAVALVVASCGLGWAGD